MQLLRRNCDYDTKNAAGKEAWQLAFEFNYSELGEYIRDKTGLPPLAEGQNAANVADSGGGGGEEENEGDDDGFLDLLGEFFPIYIYVYVCIFHFCVYVFLHVCMYVRMSASMLHICVRKTYMCM